jgi:anaerobic selenocysteine-containing dehydrogenase
MLSVLEKSKANGAKVIAINPLPEAGLLRFKDPQKVHGVLGAGVAIADAFLQIRIGGDQALFQGLAKLLLEADDRHPGSVVDREFIDAHCAGFDEYAAHIRNVDLDDVVQATGLSIGQIVETAQALMASERTVICWAMGLTQHTHAVATIQDAVAVLLLRGMIGKPGAGVCPVRGRSNVQGDRTMGIWEKRQTRFSMPSTPSSASPAPARTVWTPSTRSGRCATNKKCRYLSRWAATSSGRLPTLKSPRRRCATAR